MKMINVVMAAFLALTASFQTASYQNSSLLWNPGVVIQPSTAQFQSASAPLAPGDLDPTFGEGGLATADMNGNSGGRAVVLQPDGKIVVAGEGAAGMLGGGAVIRDFTLSRYNPDGSLDATFGAHGKVVTDFNNTDDNAHAIALQKDGKIIAAGMSSDGSTSGTDCGLVRYNGNGSLDTTFGIDGRVTLDFGWWCNAIALQSNGKIIVAVGVPNEAIENNNGIGLVQFNNDGSLDTTFGDNGMVKTYSVDYQYGMGALTLQTDGKILVAGSATYKLANPEFALARYNSNGSLDTSFGTNGIVITAFGCCSIGFAVTTQTDSKIIMAGLSDNAGLREFILARFNSNGSLDNTFGANGKTTTDFGGYGGYGTAVSVQPDHKIVVTGIGSYNFAVARYNPDGSLDPSFGTDGKATTDFGGEDHSFAGLLQPDGKIVVVGYAINQLSVSNTALVRYNSDGSLDPAFDTDGMVITKFGGSFDYSYAMALQPDGKAVMAGATSSGGYYIFSLSRFNLDGSLDDTFGSGGVTYTKIDGIGGHAYAVAVQPDAKIVLAGGTYDGAMYFDFGLARFNSDGSLDSAFGSNGIVSTDFDNRPDGSNAIALQSDGKIVAAGWTVYQNAFLTYDFALARYDSSGRLDTTFGNGGKVTTDFNGFNDGCSAIVLQPDQKIVAVGSSTNNNPPSDSDFALVRYNSNGTLDAAFGTNGKVITDFGGEDVARSATLQEDGKIVVTGDSSGNSLLVRYNSDGSLDTTFGNRGKTGDSLGDRGKASTYSGGSDYGRAVAVQPDGRIIVGGDSNNDFALARYFADGSLDATFGASGRVTTDFGGSVNHCIAIALQADGKAVAAGYTNRNSNYDFAAARYLTASEPKLIYLT